jgi:hypothetical protein
MPADVHRSGLWSDEPHNVDLLAFSAVAATVIDAVLDETLDPLAIGVSGSSSSGAVSRSAISAPTIRSSSSAPTPGATTPRLGRRKP